jgi:SPP1 gp7 family putative phage head morphogenesis protein
MPITAEEVALLGDEVIVSDGLRAETATVVEGIVSSVGAWELSQIGATVSFNVVDARVIGYLIEYGGFRIRNVDFQTQRAVTLELAKGVQAGEGGEALRRRVDDAFATSPMRARRIARTEVNAAANFARMTAQEQSGFVRERRWLATLDSRVRDRHARLHGQVAPLGSPFQIDGRTAMYPGGFAGAADNVNCRCTTVPVVRRLNSDESDSGRSTQRKFDSIVDGFEVVLGAAALNGFLRQKRAVLLLLDRLDR